MRDISKSVKLTRKKLMITLELMTRAGLLRSEFDGHQRFYRIPDRDLFGDPPDPKEPKTQTPSG
jgi:predicted transcriptional regulator